MTIKNLLSKFRPTLFKQRKHKVIFGTVAIISCLSIYFTNADPAAPVLLDSGVNSTVYRVGDFVVKDVRSGVDVAQDLVSLTNDVAEAFPSLVPEVSYLGDAKVAQQFVDGVDFYDLSPEVQQVARGQAKQIVQQAQQTLGEKWIGRAFSGGEKVILPNNTLAFIDDNPGNFKYSATGKPVSWFDPVGIDDHEKIAKEMKQFGDETFQDYLSSDHITYSGGERPAPKVVSLTDLSKPAANGAEGALVRASLVQAADGASGFTAATFGKAVLRTVAGLPFQVAVAVAAPTQLAGPLTDETRFKPMMDKAWNEYKAYINNGGKVFTYGDFLTKEVCGGKCGFDTPVGNQIKEISNAEIQKRKGEAAASFSLPERAAMAVNSFFKGALPFSKSNTSNEVRVNLLRELSALYAREVVLKNAVVAGNSKAADIARESAAIQKRIDYLDAKIAYYSDFLRAKNDEKTFDMNRFRNLLSQIDTKAGIKNNNQTSSAHLASVGPKPAPAPAPASSRVPASTPAPVVGSTQKPPTTPVAQNPAPTPAPQGGSTAKPPTGSVAQNPAPTPQPQPVPAPQAPVSPKPPQPVVTVQPTGPVNVPPGVQYVNYNGTLYHAGDGTPSTVIPDSAGSHAGGVTGGTVAAGSLTPVETQTVGDTSIHIAPNSMPGSVTFVGIGDGQATNNSGVHTVTGNLQNGDTGYWQETKDLGNFGGPKGVPGYVAFDEHGKQVGMQSAQETGVKQGDGSDAYHHIEENRKTSWTVKKDANGNLQIVAGVIGDKSAEEAAATPIIDPKGVCQGCNFLVAPDNYYFAGSGVNADPTTHVSIGGILPTKVGIVSFGETTIVTDGMTTKLPGSSQNSPSDSSSPGQPMPASVPPGQPTIVTAKGADILPGGAGDDILSSVLGSNSSNGSTGGASYSAILGGNSYSATSGYTDAGGNPLTNYQANQTINSGGVIYDSFGAGQGYYGAVVQVDPISGAHTGGKPRADLGNP